jgi:hypothetical protein
LYVQKTCLSVPKEDFLERIDQIIAKMPVKAANNTPAEDLLGWEADPPKQRNLEPAAAPEESAVAPLVARQSSPQALTPDKPSSNDVFRAEICAAGIIVMLLAVVLQAS